MKYTPTTQALPQGQAHLPDVVPIKPSSTFHKTSKRRVHHEHANGSMIHPPNTATRNRKQYPALQRRRADRAPRSSDANQWSTPARQDAESLSDRPSSCWTLRGQDQMLAEPDQEPHVPASYRLRHAQIHPVIQRAPQPYQPHPEQAFVVKEHETPALRQPYQKPQPHAAPSYPHSL